MTLKFTCFQIEHVKIQKPMHPRVFTHLSPYPSEINMANLNLNEGTYYVEQELILFCIHCLRTMDVSVPLNICIYDILLIQQARFSTTAPHILDRISNRMSVYYHIPAPPTPYGLLNMKSHSTTFTSPLVS